MSDPSGVSPAVVSELRADARWRRAVWAVRFQFIGLVGVVAGLIVRSSSSVGLPIFLVALVVFLVSSAVALSGLVGAFGALPRPRPSFLDVRWVLLRDTFGAKG